MVEWQHIGDMGCCQFQRLYWDILPVNIVMEVELVNFYAGHVQMYKNSAYMEFAAIFKSELVEPEVQPEDMVIIHFPYKMMARALFAVPLRYKRWLKRSIGDDNVYLKFVKLNKFSLKIIAMEQRRITDEMKQKSELVLSYTDYPGNPYYDKPESYNKTYQKFKQQSPEPISKSEQDIPPELNDPTESEYYGDDE
jgi:hypothetical protein